MLRSCNTMVGFNKNLLDSVIFLKVTLLYFLWNYIILLSLKQNVQHNSLFKHNFIWDVITRYKEIFAYILYCLWVLSGSHNKEA